MRQKETQNLRRFRQTHPEYGGNISSILCSKAYIPSYRGRLYCSRYRNVFNSEQLNVVGSISAKTNFLADELAYSLYFVFIRLHNKRSASRRIFYQLRRAVRRWRSSGRPSGTERRLREFCPCPSSERLSILSVGDSFEILVHIKSDRHVNALWMGESSYKYISNRQHRDVVWVHISCCALPIGAILSLNVFNLP